MKDGEISQVGTPEEIVANPIDQYVKDFTEDVPKYKVLSAGKCCRSDCSDEAKSLFADGNDCVNSDTKIDVLINDIADSDKKYPVINKDTGELIGEIDRTIVLKSMTS